MIRRPPRSTLFPYHDALPILRRGMTARAFTGLRVVLVAAFNRRYHRSGLALAAALERSEEHTSELQSQSNVVCRLLLEKKNRTLLRGAATVRIPSDRPDRSGR